MRVQGNNIIVMIKKDGAWTSIAYSKTCEIDVEAETISKCSSDGKWLSSVVRKYRWNVSSSHLLSVSSHDWQSLIEEETSSMIIFGTVDRPSYLPSGGFGLKGYAYLDRYSMQANKADYVTVSAQFVGDGELESIYSYEQFMLSDNSAFSMINDGDLYVNKINVS